MSKAAAELTKDENARAAATRYLADRIYAYVVGLDQPAKLRQLTKNADVGDVSTRLLRHVMAESDRFESVDRRWAPSTRFLDAHTPLEHAISEILTSAGTPLTTEAAATLLGQVFGRPREHYEEVLPRFFSNPDKFFPVGDGRYGLASWLLAVNSDEEDDVLFDNFLTAEQVAEFDKAAEGAKWDATDLAAGAAAVLKAAKKPVPVKVVAVFAWRELGEDFDAVDFYTQMLGDERVVLLSDQKAYAASDAFAKSLAEMDAEVAALPPEPEEMEAEGPVTVTDTDKEEMVALILRKGSASAEELLDAVLEVSPEEPAFAGALESLNEALKQDERIMWIGGTRWSKVEVFPEEVKAVPEPLVVPPSVPFETPEGDIYDQELEEEGFEGDLKSAIYDPLAEDVTDEDPARTMYQPNGDSQRCVLKYHHKTAGTFPLCQINPDFFGLEPEIIPIVLSEEGKRKTVYVNNSTRLVYGMESFYKSITEVSGAVFYIEKTAKPGEYRFRYDGEVDEQLGIDTGRSLELLDLRGQYESTEMPVFDVISDILQQKSGITFAQLVNEVNIVKRCSRMFVASILSSYHCFTTRGKTGRWQYDEKKRSQGFNKTKRKYIKK